MTNRVGAGHGGRRTGRRTPASGAVPPLAPATRDRGSGGRSGRLRASLVAGILLAVSGMVPADARTEPPTVGTVDAADTFQVARLTGPQSINRTDLKWNVYGTDLGHTFEHRGQLYMAFGDTFGPPGHPPAFGSDWRSNVLAVTRDSDPSDGLTFDTMITDDQGRAKELIDNADVPGTEVTVIPTNGVSDDTRMFLHYMAVREWGPPGQWWLNRSGLAYSDDNGETWTVSDLSWPGDSNFGQVAFVEQDQHVYLLGIPGGRFGPAKLARVETRRLLDADGYRYWDGGRWVSDPDAAAVVVPAPVGELSVVWNSHYRKWLMMYLNDADDVNAVVLRTAECLAGPWSEERTVVTAEEVPQLYAPYMPPRWNRRADIFFSLSRFNFYDVFWWHTSLDGEHPSTREARCISP